MLTVQSFSNQIAEQFTPGTTGIYILGTNGTAYSTYASLVSAGTTPWPGLDPGMNSFGVLSVRSILTSGTSDGSPFFYSKNKTKPASTAVMIYVDSGGQERETPSGPLWQVWVSMTVSTDLVGVIWEY
jgi:hypothetical protein